MSLGERQTSQGIQLEGNKPQLERNGNVATIRKENGTVSIVYSPHIIEPPTPSWLKDVDGLFVETGTIDYSGDSQRHYVVLDTVAFTSKLRNVLLSTLLEHNKPVYFADVCMPSEVGFAHTMISAVEFTTGLILLNMARPHRGISIGRRAALGKIFAAPLGLWAISPLASTLARVPSTGLTPIESATVSFYNFSHTVHPEQNLLLTKLRDYVVAHKENWLMDKLGSRPYFGNIWGPAHSGFEQALQLSPSTRIDFLQKIAPLIRKFASAETVYKIVRINPDINDIRAQRSEVMEVPELKALVA